MAKYFNVTGACSPNVHYMVDLQSRLVEIRKMIDAGEYFTINRARQYGKTTILRALAEYLKEDYEIVSLDFQVMSSLSFGSEQAFVAAFAGELLDVVDNFPEGIEKQLSAFVNGKARINSLQALFKVIKAWCGASPQKIVLIIDEVDTATNNQVFLDFLAQLRAYYLKRPKTPAFQSVILAGVYDIRNMKRKIRTDEEHKQNSPWNIAAKFSVDMNFSVTEIGNMLQEYENDYHTGMNITEIAGLIYDYTSGYPLLVSALCKILDEEISGKWEFSDKNAWTSNGLLEAVKLLLSEKNALFESLIGKINDYPEMRNRISALLFQGQDIAYNVDDPVTDMLQMFGFIKVEQGTVQIANRIFEALLYNYFLTKNT